MQIRFSFNEKVFRIIMNVSCFQITCKKIWFFALKWNLIKRSKNPLCTDIETDWYRCKNCRERRLYLLSEISVVKEVTKDTWVKKVLRDIVRDLKSSRQLRLEDYFTYRRTRSIRSACSSKCAEWQNIPLLCVGGSEYPLWKTLFSRCCSLSVFSVSLSFLPALFTTLKAWGMTSKRIA